MRISIRTHAIVKLDVHYDSINESHQIKELYFAILSKVFLDKPALIITITPQKKYSIGYELGSFQEINIEKSKYLVNNLQACSSSMLAEISRSEEFGRGLLLLMVSNKGLIENVKSVLRYIGNNIGIENISSEIIFCENDGNSLCLYNTTIDSEELKSISKKITGDVVMATS